MKSSQTASLRKQTHPKVDGGILSIKNLWAVVIRITVSINANT